MKKHSATRYLGKRFFILLPCLFILIGTLSIFSAFAMQKPDVIKVAFPIQPGMTAIDADGGYSGYTYDYLQEISQYTGWKYEFVQLSGDSNEVLRKMLDMLKTGEIDLMGGILYSEELDNVYEYPSQSYGKVYTTLNVLQENVEFTENSIRTLDVFKVAMLEKAVTRKDELTKYCMDNDINLEIVEYSNEIALLQSLKNGDTDAMVDVDASGIKDGIRTIATFAERPFFFVTTGGNTKIVNKLDFALTKIYQTDTLFEANLYKKYFVRQSGQFFLSNSEKQYIADTAPLKVLISPYKVPLGYIDKETGRPAGITVDFLNRISEITGLKFDYLMADSTVAEDVQLYGALPYDYGIGSDYNVSFSRPYLSSQLLLIANKNVNMENTHDKTLATIDNYPYARNHKGKVIKYYTILECLDAIESGKADFCYSNAFIAQFYLNNATYKNIVSIPQSDMQQNISLGIAKPIDIDLLTIINKAIRYIPESEIQSMVYHHTVNNMREISLASFIDSNPRTSVALIGIAASILVFLLFLLFFYRHKAISRTLLDNQRYLQLCDLSGEYIFEYDYTRDHLILSEKCATAFNCDRTIINVKNWLNTQSGSILHKLYTQLEVGLELICEIQGGMPNSEERWFRVTIKIISSSENNRKYAIGKLVDVQDEKAEKDRLIIETQTDGLTGIYNAATSRKLIAENLSNGGGALFMLDIDKFKEINDMMGHYMGDQVLIETAKELTHMFRTSDIIGRLGGDEFVVYMQGQPDITEISAKAKGICEKLNRTIYGENSQLDISVSIGIAVSHTNETFTTLYKRADSAMYFVKNKEKNGFEVSTE